MSTPKKSNRFQGTLLQLSLCMITSVVHKQLGEIDAFVYKRMLKTDFFLGFVDRVLKQFFPCKRHILITWVFLIFFLASLPCKQSRKITFDNLYLQPVWSGEPYLQIFSDISFWVPVLGTFIILNTCVRYSLTAGEILPATFCFLRAHPWWASPCTVESGWYWLALIFRLFPLTEVAVAAHCLRIVSYKHSL